MVSLAPSLVFPSLPDPPPSDILLADPPLPDVPLPDPLLPESMGPVVPFDRLINDLSLVAMHATPPSLLPTPRTGLAEVNVPVRSSTPRASHASNNGEDQSAMYVKN